MDDLARDGSDDVRKVGQPSACPLYRYSLSRFSIGASLSQTLFPVSTDVESDSCGICVVSPHSQSLYLSVYIGVYFPKEKKLN